MEDGSVSETRMKILIKYPTRQRPQWFRKAIANIYNTISDQENFRILVTCDEDDITMQNPAMIEFMKGHENLHYVFGKSESKIHAVNRDMNLADEWFWPWDVLVVMSDDFHFPNFGWDNTIRQRVKDTWGESKDWYGHWNDGYAGDALPTMSIMGRDYYNRDGFIYNPAYKSFSCDAEQMFVAKTRGRHQYFNEIIARHQHPANTPMPNDELYAANSLHTPHDTKLYWERLHNDFGMKEEGYAPPFIWDVHKKY